ncbi:zinc-ribbon domain-containing protein, partial [Dehalococcoidia bacterium]|nr:zinc-ribbon domain-containing protein [Dehalococcoidia bacterium]
RHEDSCSSCGHDNPQGSRFCSSCGTALRPLCGACGTEIVESGARFCNQCGADLMGAADAASATLSKPVASAPPAAAGPTPTLSLPSVGPTVALPTHVEEQEAVAEGAFPAPGFLEHSKSHRSQMFYLGIFIALAIVTVVEIFIFYIPQEVIRIPSLILLSTAKFILVVMFFMHLKGDKRFFSALFVVPFFLAIAVLIALVGLLGGW